MSYEEALAYMEQYQCLPLCEHGNHVIDWGRDLLAPPCGCSLTQDAPDLVVRAETQHNPLDALCTCRECWSKLAKRVI